MNGTLTSNGSTLPTAYSSCAAAIVHTHRYVSLPSTNGVVNRTDTKDIQANNDVNGAWKIPLLPPLEMIRTKRPIRVYIDGCFDVMHFGHSNALRQAKALGDELLVGVCSSREIAIHKGPSVMSDDERVGVVSGMKWVDEILRDAPYVLTDDFLRTLIETHRIDLVVHGDDPCTGANGVDAYATAKRAGRFRTIKRTEGVSSTDVVQRLLDRSLSKDTKTNNATADGDQACFLMTARRVVQFAGRTKAPRVDERVVYVHGSFDLFHSGHVDLLKRARQLGDFLLVGIVSDSIDSEHVMNVHERSLMVLGCRHVDDVIIGAPQNITHDLVTSMNISVVVQCVSSDSNSEVNHTNEDSFKVATQLGLLHQLHVQYPDLEVQRIVERVSRRRIEYEARNLRKLKANKEYTYRHKIYVEEG